MPIPLKRLMLWSAALPVLAGAAYAGHTLSQLAPLGTAYAAKALCSGVFVSGRPAAAVIDEDIMTGVHPLLKLVHPSVDRARRVARASFVGLAVREAEFRPGLGCTLDLGVPAAALADASLPRSTLSDPPQPDAAPPDAPRPVAAPPVAPIPAGVDAQKLWAAVAAAFAEPDPAQPRRTRAVVVMYRGRVIAERYAPGFDANMPLLGWSMTKSVTATLAGLLVNAHRLDVNAAALLPEWRGAGDPRARITLDELLRMTSGLRFNEDYDHPPSDVAVMLYARPDGAAYAAAQPLAFPPGTHWHYSSGTSAIVARVLRGAFDSDADYLQFPRRALFAPLGMRTAVFEPDASGTLAGASFMYASARDWATFGQFLLQDGVWNGQRLLPEGWVRYMTRVTPQSPRQDFGAHLWVKVPAPFTSRTSPAPSLPADAFHAVGHEGQFVSVIPSRQLVVVRLGLSRPESVWDHETFLARILDAFAAARD
ncbi:serine hydrolase domain-containing protein [Burkholderia guangdongensis]|uniref:serine hydrolase domain-containing protein n=1 Tax=Burkholderia guangdongensis TaxID=1792500 RepID=UPI0015CBDFDF|nr:serine hydrolase [Burkholderia guangdongensis]